MSIIKTNIIPPAITEKIIPRKTLDNLLFQNSARKLIVVTSPAGFGKTTFVLNYLNNNNKKYAWLHVREEMNNFYSFIQYIVASFRAIEPAFGENALQIKKNYSQRFQFTKYTETIVKDITGTLINDLLSSFSEDIYLVLDDFDNLKASDWLKDFFNEFVNGLPNNIHIIITSRKALQMNFSALAAKRGILKINDEQLKFSNAEAKRLLEEIYSIKAGDDSIALLQKKIDGWVTGIHLVIQAYGQDYDKIDLKHKRILDEIFDFFASNIYDKLDPEIKDFMLETSILENFTAGTANEALGRKNSEQLLEEILSKNIFLRISRTDTQNADPEPAYNYQALFKEFLSDKLRELKTQKHIDELILKIIKYYLSKNDYVNAVTNLLKSSRQADAIPLIIKHFNELFEKGEFEVLWNWISAINDDITQHNGDLLYFKARLLQFYKGDIEGSIPLLERAVLYFEKNRNREDSVKARILKTRNLMNLGRINEAIEVLNNLLVKKTSADNRSKILYNLSFAYYQNALYNEALDYLNKAVDTCRKNNISANLVNIYKLFGHIYLIRGEYIKSSLYYEKVLEQSKGLIDNFEVHCNLSLLYSQSANTDKAYQQLKIVEQAAEKIPTPIIQIACMLARQGVSFELGDYENTLEILEKIAGLAKKISHRYYQYLACRLMADTYYHMNRLVSAEKYYDLSFNYIDDDNILDKTEYAVMKTLLLKKSELNEKIEKTLIEALDYYTKNQYTFNATQVHVYLAEYYYAISVFTKCKEHLLTGLKTAKEKEYCSFISRELKDCRYLYDFALANNIEHAFIRQNLETWFLKEDEKTGSPGFNSRLKKEIESLYDVSLCTFGNIELKIRGEEIPDSFWQKKKWKSIFIYLLTQPGYKLTKDQIIDRFYQDTPVKSAENIFRQIVSKFRSLLKHDTADDKQKNRSSALPLMVPLVLYEGKTLALNNELFYNIDFIEYEKLISLIRYTNNNDEKISLSQKAINIYKRDLWESNYETWCEELRTGYKNSFINVTESLISNFYDMKLYDEAIEYSKKLRSVDRLNDLSFEIEIKCYYDSGRKSLARDVTKQMFRAYNEVLGEEPPQDLIEKFKIILT